MEASTAIQPRVRPPKLRGPNSNRSSNNPSNRASRDRCLRDKEAGCIREEAAAAAELLPSVDTTRLLSMAPSRTPERAHSSDRVQRPERADSSALPLAHSKPVRDFRWQDRHSKHRALDFVQPDFEPTCKR